MIINDFYPTVDYGKNTRTLFTDNIDSLNISQPDFIKTYNIGYISPDVIPRMHKMSKITKTGNSITVKDITAPQNIDVLYTSKLSDSVGDTDTQRALRYSETWQRSHTTNGNTPPTYTHFVNNCNLKTVSMKGTNLRLCFSFYGKYGYYDNTVTYWCGWYDTNANNLLSMISSDTTQSILISIRPDVPDSNYDESFNFTFKPSDFKNGYVSVDTTTRDGRYYVRGIVVCHGIADYTSLPDSWQGKNWSASGSAFSTTLYNTYVIKTTDNFSYISGITSQYGLRTTIDRYNLYNAQYPYVNINYVSDFGSGYMLGSCNIDVPDITDTSSPYIVGDGCVFLNNYNTPRITLLTTFDDILKQLVLQPRVFFGSDSHNAHVDNANVIYPEIIDNQFTGGYIYANDTAKLTDWQRTSILTDNTYNSDTDKPPYIPKNQSDFGDLTSAIGINIQTVTSGKLYKIPVQYANTVLNYIGGTYSTDTIMSTSDGLISFSFYPFDVPSSNVSTVPKIGAYNDNGTIKGFSLPPTATYLQVTATSYLINLGSVRIYPYYNDFRDYAPYTTYSAFIPFINTSYNIDYTIFKNHTIGFKLIIDVLTGSGICCIMRDNLLYDTLNGTIATQININSADVAQYNASIKAAENAMQSIELNAKLAMVNAVTGIGTSIVSQNPMSAVQSLSSGLSAVANAALQRDMIEYDLSTTQVHHSMIQSASANCGNQLERNVHIIIAHAKMSDSYNADIYSKTVGYACCKNDVIANCINYTQTADMDLTGLTITDVEKNLIKTAFANGVIIK